MLPTREDLLAKAKSPPAPPVAIEARWDGDTTGWMVILSLVCVDRSQFRKRYYDHQLGVLRGSRGDLRLFDGIVPPWPEAALASEVGRELAKQFGVPFYFASPHHPEDQCPRWWERKLGHPCRDCGVLLLQSDTCPWWGFCHHCHLAEDRNQNEPSNRAPNLAKERNRKMPVGLGLVLVYVFLTGIAAVFGAAIYPSKLPFYLGYGIACLVAVVGTLNRSKTAWYLLFVLLSMYLVIYGNTLSYALISSSEAGDRLIAKKIIQMIPLTAALYYLFTSSARTYFVDLDLSLGKRAATPAEAGGVDPSVRYPPSSEGTSSMGSDSTTKILSAADLELDDTILDWFGTTLPDVIRVWAGSARILRVTEKQLDYVDESGREQSVDLEKCAINWCRYWDEKRSEFVSLDPNTSDEDADRWGASCVGTRDICATTPWVMFMNERCTLFKFKTRDQAYAELLRPLHQAGWHTFDFG